MKAYTGDCGYLVRRCDLMKCPGVSAPTPLEW
eukprot:CAMPEP_0179149202 /NCGR_PEP_ID=MMETSP0796-20121207/72262_1 /TAXON_ID=73915 /ORGANISM="Pyrodinium bahamense, Strain pbaha01" /LENGTH=31 /DNA_ID= /DNA_START= /DNA_END= /DNA_ORIENTATION=